MALNLTALSQGSSKAVGLGNLILVSPQQTTGYQPQNAPSWAKNTAAPPKALLFNYEGEQSATLTSDITDHYIENNTAVQDQIALRPEIITTQGFVGELNDIAPGALQPLKTAAEKLTTISAYTPQLSTTALLAYANAFALYQTAASVINSAASAWSSINGNNGESVINGNTQVDSQGNLAGASPNQSQQQIYFQQFYAYWKNRTLFTIQTPWAIFQDMAIQSLRAVQNADTRVITDFEVTFKLLRFASTASTDASLYGDNSNFQGRASNQGAVENDLGTQTLATGGPSFGTLIG